MVDSDDSGDERADEDDRDAVAKQIFEEDDEEGGDEIDEDELNALAEEQEQEGLVPTASRRRERQEGGEGG